MAESKKQLRLSNEEDWLPAVQVIRGGVFFEFNEDLIRQWREREDVRVRIKHLNTSYQRSFMGAEDNR